MPLKQRNQAKKEKENKEQKRQFQISLLYNREITREE